MSVYTSNFELQFLKVSGFADDDDDLLADFG